MTRPPIIHEAITLNPDPTEFLPIEVNSAFPEGAESTFSPQEKAYIDSLIEAVPDKNDTRAINYWLDWGKKKVYLEGWIDQCLTGTGFPPMGGGDWDDKIEYMVRVGYRTLIEKQEERNRPFIGPGHWPLVEGGFREFEAGDKDWLYGVTWGVYEFPRGGTGAEKIAKMEKQEGNPGVPDKGLLKVAIEREPLKVARQLGYEVHRLSPTDIVDKADYASGFRFRLSKAVQNQPYPQIVMARSEGEVVTFLKRQTEVENPGGSPVPTGPDNLIPKTLVTSLGVEFEIPVARAVVALLDENPWSSGFHETLNQRWTIVFRGKISDKAAKAAQAAGLEVTYREAPVGTGQILTDVSLPGVGITQIEKATQAFNRFAELYEGSALEGLFHYREEAQAKMAKSYAEGLGYRASLQHREGTWELTIQKPSYLEEGNPMISDVDTALKDIADRYVQKRREMTEPELEAILLKHCGSEAEVQKFVRFLQTEPGQLRFKTLLRERYGNMG